MSEEVIKMYVVKIYDNHRNIKATKEFDYKPTKAEIRKAVRAVKGYTYNLDEVN